ENAHRIATYAEVSRRALRNTAWLSQYLANRFIEKWVKLLNTQVLVGDGIGENLDGVVNQATAYAAAGDYTNTIPTGESTLIDAVIAMKSQLYDTANVMANACFVSPVTHYQLTVQKTTTRAYAYDQTLAQVDENGIWRINGMALVMSKDIPNGDALIGLITPNVLQLLMNGGLDMATTQSHSTNFVASLVAFRFEADVLFPIYRPYAFITGTLATVQADITA
ncbi:MAG: phage major capsid protein, partial [Bacteroidetes bacterium]